MSWFHASANLRLRLDWFCTESRPSLYWVWAVFRLKYNWVLVGCTKKKKKKTKAAWAWARVGFGLSLGLTKLVPRITLDQKHGLKFNTKCSAYKLCRTDQALGQPSPICRQNSPFNEGSADCNLCFSFCRMNKSTWVSFCHNMGSFPFVESHSHNHSNNQSSYWVMFQVVISLNWDGSITHQMKGPCKAMTTLSWRDEFFSFFFPIATLGSLKLKAKLLRDIIFGWVSERLLVGCACRTQSNKLIK